MQKEIVFFLIDDDVDDQDFFAEALESINPEIKCTIAKDGNEALEIIKKDENFIPSFIFMDLNMPKMDGRLCLSEMKKITRLQDTPIYIYSTTSEILLNLGASGCIKKQYKIEELVRILSEIISAR